MEIRILSQKAEMLAQLDIVKQLYPDFTVEEYGTLLDEMLKANYQQIIVIKKHLGFGENLYVLEYIENGENKLLGLHY